MSWLRAPRIVETSPNAPGNDANRASRLEQILILTVWVGLAAALVGLLWFYEVDSENGIPVTNPFDGIVFTPRMSDNLFGILAFATGCGLLVRALLVAILGGLGPLLRKVERVVLFLLVILSAGHWLYGAGGLARSKYVHFYDAYHYFLGPKYYEELRYFDLYECTILADAETTRSIRNQDTRNLRRYGFTKTDRVLEKSQCKSNFTPERWESFRADYETIAKAAGPRTMHRVIRDYGYNGTPFNAWVGGGIAHSFHLDYASITFATLIDTLSICALMAAIALTFGWNLGGLVAIAFFTAFSDRFAYIGGSFFRYHWMVLTGFGLIAMARRRYATSSVLISLAAMLNVFPVLFLLGLGGKACIDWIRTQTIQRVHLRFAGVSIATALGAFLLSLLQPGGLTNWREFFGDMSKHSQLVTVSRIGFRYVFLYRGESSSEGFSNAARTVELQTLSPFVYVLTALALCCILYLLPRISDLEATIVTGFGTFFFALGTVEYYFGIYAFWLLIFDRFRRDPASQIILGASFLLSAAVYWVWDDLHFLALCNNTLMSASILTILTSTFVYIARRTEPSANAHGTRFVLVSVALIWTIPLILTLVRWPA